MKIPKHPRNKKVSNNKLIELSKKGRQYYLRNFNNFPENICIVNVNGYDVFVDIDQTVEAIVDKSFTERVHKEYDTYTQINGKIYSYSSPLIIRAKDTNNYILEENGYRGYYGCYEKNENLVYNKRDKRWIHKNFAVTTKDTKLWEHRERVRRVGEGYYFKYSQMAIPKETWNHAPYTKESLFPDNISERRIGVEYEFTQTFNMFEPFLAGGYKFLFDSVRDGSLDDYSQGIEFVSVPVKLSQLDKATDFINFAKKNGANITNGCGFHVHVGASDFSFMDISRLVALALSVESEMFQLGGTDRQNNTYCKKLTERFYGFQDIVLPKDKNKVGHQLYDGMEATFKDRHQRSKYVDARGHRGVRYYWFNIDRFFYKREQPEQKTVEFRNHKATWNSDDFHNFSLLCYYLVEFAKNHSKKTCQKATLSDVVKTSNIQHRKQLTTYLKNKL